MVKTHQADFRGPVVSCVEKMLLGQEPPSPNRLELSRASYSLCAQSFPVSSTVLSIHKDTRVLFGFSEFHEWGQTWKVLSWETLSWQNGCEGQDKQISKCRVWFFTEISFQIRLSRIWFWCGSVIPYSWSSAWNCIGIAFVHPELPVCVYITHFMFSRFLHNRRRYSLLDGQLSGGNVQRRDELATIWVGRHRHSPLQRHVQNRWMMNSVASPDSLCLQNAYKDVVHVLQDG